MSRGKWLIVGLVIIILAIVIVLLVHFARKAEPRADVKDSWITNTLIAHRGYYNNEEHRWENTLPAFEAAAERGYAIELDVTLTKDNKVIVYHDKKIKRIFGVEGYVSDLTYAELSKLQFPGTTDTMPLFEDVLKLVNGRVPIMIEIKNEGKIGDLEQRLNDTLKGYNGQFAVESFNPFSVAWFKKNAPEVIRGQLAGSFEVTDDEVKLAGTTRLSWYKKILLSNLLFDFESRPNFIAYEVKNTSPDKIEEMHKLGVPVIGWTISDVETYNRDKDQYDNFITEVFNLK